MKLEYSFPDDFPPIAKPLTESILVLDPLLRPDFPLIRSDAFFKGVDWDSLESSTPPTLPRLARSDSEDSVDQDDFFYAMDGLQLVGTRSEGPTYPYESEEGVADTALIALPMSPVVRRAKTESGGAPSFMRRLSRSSYASSSNSNPSAPSAGGGASSGGGGGVEPMVRAHSTAGTFSRSPFSLTSVASPPQSQSKLAVFLSSPVQSLVSLRASSSVAVKEERALSSASMSPMDMLLEENELKLLNGVVYRRKVCAFFVMCFILFAASFGIVDLMDFRDLGYFLC
jgi:hypothetical protein